MFCAALNLVCYLAVEAVKRRKNRGNHSALFAASNRFDSNPFPTGCLGNFFRVQTLGSTLLPGLSLIAATFVCATGLTHAGENEKLIRVTTKRNSGCIHFTVENLQKADVTVTFDMDLTNLEGNVEFPHTTTVGGGQKTEVFQLSPIDADSGWDWQYTYYANFGNMDAVHDDAYVYSLPYAHGKSFRVSQGFNGEYSHHGPNQYAIDWRMPVGTPIHAARAGVVVALKRDSNRGGADAKYDSEANYILIRHDDGTLGHYVHLMKDGVKVKIGQHVRTGQLIGLSGNTGHTTGPHLHFAVFKAKNGKERESIPIRFQTSTATAAILESGRSYTALDPAGSRYGWLKLRAAEVLTLTPAVQ